MPGRCSSCRRPPDACPLPSRHPTRSSPTSPPRTLRHLWQLRSFRLMLGKVLEVAAVDDSMAILAQSCTPATSGAGRFSGNPGPGPLTWPVIEVAAQQPPPKKNKKTTKHKTPPQKTGEKYRR